MVIRKRRLDYREKIARLDLKWCDEYKSISDEEVINLVQKEDDPLALEYLLRKYQKLVYGRIKNKYSQIGTIDDLIQEGMVGLLEGIYNYDFNAKASYISFFRLCIISLST